MKAKEIVIVSGKGGSGKTTMTAAFAHLLSKKIIVDADVDATDLYILLKPKILKRKEFKGKSFAYIEASKCIKCNVCKELCRFDAITVENNIYSVNPIKCDSCTLCKIACPVQAIEMMDSISGEWFESDTLYGKMVHARLSPGAENSGNLVTMVKRRSHMLAEKDDTIKYIIVDGPPGIGCPVISTLSSSDFVLVIAEPSPSGLHDLKRLKTLIDSFKLKSGLVVNKYDLNIDITNKMKEFAFLHEMIYLKDIPYDKCVLDALINESIVSLYCPHIKNLFLDIINNVLGVL